MISKAKLKYFQSLSQKKVRELEGRFLIEGWRTIEDASSVVSAFEALIFTKEAEMRAESSGVFSSAKSKSKEMYKVSAREFAAISDTVHAQGIAAVVKTFAFDFEEQISSIVQRESAFVVLLDQIAEPGNLGAIIRTADWFGADAIILSENCVELYNPKVVRSTVGSIFHLPIIEANKLAEATEFLKKSGFTLYGTELNGSKEIQAIRWAKKSVVVIGNEAHGIRSEISSLLDEHLVIPKFGRAESLNAGIAVGIIFAHRRFQV
jgi:TrmH family RNA methyltransferase